MAELTSILEEYVYTALDPTANGDWDLIDSKFPELANFDKEILKEYVATAVDAGYDWNTNTQGFELPG